MWGKLGKLEEQFPILEYTSPLGLRVFDWQECPWGEN
jgi:hypothetical protein